ncbi:MAG: polyribonucleotide nucleotidyltransferase [Eggerthella lenta]
MEKIVESFELYGKQYRLETGELAKQATGSVVVTQGDTTVLVTAVISKEEKDYDFFPLTVDFIEKMYAVGRIPGGYLKREARPSDKGTLTARMVDRPIRPGFADGFKREVHVVCTTLVVDSINPPDTICVMGASAALMLGAAPFDGPAACVRIGRDVETGEFIVNPTFEESENSDLELTIAGTADYISMVEAGADEISEEDMLAAMTFGQEAIAAFCEAQQRFLDRANIEPVEWPVHVADPAIAERVAPFMAEMSAALRDADKLSRMGKVEELKARIKEEQFSDEERAAWKGDIAAELKKLEKKAMRAMVIETGERADGRRPEDIRPLYIVPGYLPRVHGSGLFQRGQTQALSVCTLGMLNEWQRLDTIDPAEGKRYMHQYNFPPYCTGETGRMGAPKRREIGHGALAERALIPVLPSEDEFPYAIRVVSEVLESNGSSSMASTCGSTLALMDAGVPIKAPVSGIAMGLIKEGDDVVILSDIQGIEDFLGDMDFKVCGTAKGITALQMDNKARGLSVDILARALKQASEGRAYILDAMLETIAAPREELSEFAPRIETIHIPVDKIRDVIGSGGKVVRGIQEETGASINIEEDGTIHIAAIEGPAGEAAKAMILGIVKEPEVGETFDGEVVGIKDFGAFVKLTPGKDGLLHISRVANGRVGKVEDVLNLGDIIKVEVLEVDPKTGKISLDRLDKPDAPESSASNGERRERGDRNGGRDNRPGRSGREGNGGGNRTPRRRHDASRFDSAEGGRSIPRRQ